MDETDDDGIEAEGPPWDIQAVRAVAELLHAANKTPGHLQAPALRILETMAKAIAEYHAPLQILQRPN